MLTVPLDSVLKQRRGGCPTSTKQTYSDRKSEQEREIWQDGLVPAGHRCRRRVRVLPHATVQVADKSTGDVA